MNRDVGEKIYADFMETLLYTLQFAYNEEVKDSKRISAQLMCAVDKQNTTYLDVRYLDPVQTNGSIFFHQYEKNPRFFLKIPIYVER